MIKTSKNATMLFIKRLSENTSIKTAYDLQQALIEQSAKDELPTSIGLACIRKEVNELL